MKRWIPVFFRRKIMYTDINNLKELQKENEELNRNYIMSKKAADACIEKLEKENKKLKKLLAHNK